MSNAKPPVLVRLGLLGFLWWFAAIEHNPLVRLQAELGLSPSPLERLFGIRGTFSGMTEGVHRLAMLDLRGAIHANVLVVPVILATALAIAFWHAPKLDTRTREFTFFALVIAGTAINNIAPWMISP